VSILKPQSVSYGHYECRSLDESLRVFTDLLCTDVVARGDDYAVIEHPNTPWRLVVHEAGSEAPSKPHSNHYGYRVASHTEIDAAASYLRAHQADYGLTLVDGPRASHFAYSVYIEEPGGNTIEIEYYNPKAAAHGRLVAAPHWETPLPQQQSCDRGYTVQALSHGTLECDDKILSNYFYTEVLGLHIMGGGNISTYIGHRDKPWYIVVLPTTHRSYLRPVNRYTLTLASEESVRTAYAEIGAAEWGISELRELHVSAKDAWFVFADLDRNWWEITSSTEPNHLALE